MTVLKEKFHLYMTDMVRNSRQFDIGRGPSKEEKLSRAQHAAATPHGDSWSGPKHGLEFDFPHHFPYLQNPYTLPTPRYFVFLTPSAPTSAQYLKFLSFPANSPPDLPESTQIEISFSTIHSLPPWLHLPFGSDLA